MSPPEARLAAETVKAQVRAENDPASAQRSAERSRRAEESRKQTCSACSAWLARYATERMLDGHNKYQRDELRLVRFALQELALVAAYPEECTPRNIRELANMHR